jgi:hypothetical protein
MEEWYQIKDPESIEKGEFWPRYGLFPRKKITNLI